LFIELIETLKDSVVCLVCYLLTSELEREFLGSTPNSKLKRLFCNSRAWWEHFRLLRTILENSLSLKILSSEKSKQDAAAVTQANKHSTIEAKVMQAKRFRQFLRQLAQYDKASLIGWNF